MRNLKKAGIVASLLIGALALTGCGNEEESKGFSPRLDTEAQVTLSTTGFFGNFEALDQVTNDFNKFYPNVTFSYEQVSGENFEEYLEANPKVDIFMTSQEIFDAEGSHVEEYCVDLSKEDINFDDLDEAMLERAYHGKKLSSIPMGQNVYGVIVNVSLLEKEGLTVPDNYEKFVKAVTTLKEKGYTPIQGPESKVYAELSIGMALDTIIDDEDLYKDLLAGKDTAVDKLMPVFDKLNGLTSDGLTDKKVNETYPDDNYDQAILNFFEGDVPFWVCNTEKVSGMKKRESKSEAFQANPFKYEYIYAPLGEKGGYAYTEPWFGFSVNKNGENLDYAMEFMRFLVTKDEINAMADIKGVPSIAKEKNELEIYKNISDLKNTQMSCINKGEITPAIMTNWYTCVNKYEAGEFATEKEALEYFVKACSGQAE